MKKLIFLALIALSTQAFAEGFVGIGLGQASADVDAAPIGAVVPSIDDTDTSLKIFGGVMFNPNFGVEVGYINLGEYGALWDDGIDYLKYKAEASALYFAGLGVAPINEQFGFYAKAGLASWSLDTKETSSFGYAYSASESGIDLMFGVGGQLSINNLLLRLEFERFSDVGDPDTTGQSDVDVIGFSAALRF